MELEMCFELIEVVDESLKEIEKKSEEFEWIIQESLRFKICSNYKKFEDVLISRRFWT
jgi:hypothetical protein